MNNQKGDRSKTETRQFQLEGLHCAACAAAVARAVESLGGIEKVELNPLTQRMVLKLDASMQRTNAQIIEAIQKAGYDGRALDEESILSGVKSEEENKEGNKTKDSSLQEYALYKKRFWPSLLFLLPLILISMGEMMGLNLPIFLSGTDYSVHFALTQLFLTLPIIYINRTIFRSGFKSLIRRSPNMDALIAIGSGAALIYGVLVLYQMASAQAGGNQEQLLHLRHSLYFESAAMILTLISLGKMLEARAKSKTSSAISQLMELMPDKAEVERDGKLKTIPVDEVLPGDLILLRPGQKVAVDGLVVSGYSSLDSSAITGESMPLEIKEGDRVLSGMVNQTGTLRFRAEKIGSESTLAQIVKLVEEASSSKAPISKLADRVAAVFVPIVLVIALLTLIVHLLSGQAFEQALSYGITVLVISCPCALGLATPVAIMVGTGQGAQNGILIRSAEALEHAGQVQCVVMDKTGTLTEGKPRVQCLVLSEKDKHTEAELLQVLASLEAASEHPLARAIADLAEDQKIVLLPVRDFSVVPGRGVSALVNGNEVMAGNQEYMEENQVQINEEWQNEADRMGEAGETSLFVAVNQELRLILGLADALKKGSAEAVQAMKSKGLQTVLLTGDRETVAKPLATQLGIDQVFGGVLPAEKSKHIETLKKGKDGTKQKVMMIGDGINDAPALALADVSVAMGAGTDIAMESADLILLSNDLRSAVNAIGLSRATVRNIKENLFWAFFYNVLGIPLAAGVFSAWGLSLTPMFGAAAMSFSSLFVLGNALRLRRYKPEFKLNQSKASEKRENRAFERRYVAKGEDYASG